MLLRQNVIKKRIENVEVLLSRFSSPKELQNGYFATVNSHILFRSGSIETPEKEKELIKAITSISKKLPFRFLSCQINTPLDEWELIQNQHVRLIHLNEVAKSLGKVAHLNVPVDYLFLSSSDIPSEFAAKAVEKLSSHLNIEAWMTYSEWFNEEAEKILHTFRPEAADEYQLQAVLESFGLEIHSVFDREVQQELQKSLIEMGRLVIGEKLEPHVTLFTLEKKVILLREKLKKTLLIKQGLLKNIVEGIEKIEEAHPELLSFKFLTNVLAILIGDDLEKKGELTWSKKILLIQLLNQQLGVITGINCHDGLERTSVAFSLMTAIAEISPPFLAEGLTKVILYEDNPEITHLMQKCVLANLKKLSLPLMSQSKSKGSTALDLQENREFLKYLPSDQNYTELVKQLSSR